MTGKSPVERVLEVAKHFGVALFAGVAGGAIVAKDYSSIRLAVIIFLAWTLTVLIWIGIDQLKKKLRDKQR